MSLCYEGRNNFVFPVQLSTALNGGESSLKRSLICVNHPGNDARDTADDQDLHRESVETERGVKVSVESPTSALKIRLHPWTRTLFSHRNQREHKVHTLSFTTSAVLSLCDVCSILKQVAKDCWNQRYPEATQREHFFAGKYLCEIGFRVLHSNALWT